MKREFTVQQLNAALFAMGDFQPGASHDPEADQLVFLLDAEQYVSRRMDGVITLFIGMNSGNVVGFKVKGFRALFDKFSPSLGIEGTDAEFFELTTFIEKVFLALLEEQEIPRNIQHAYFNARRMAEGFKVEAPQYTYQ